MDQTAKSVRMKKKLKTPHSKVHKPKTSSSSISSTKPKSKSKMKIKKRSKSKHTLNVSALELPPPTSAHKSRSSADKSKSVANLKNTKSGSVLLKSVKTGLKSTKTTSGMKPKSKPKPKHMKRLKKKSTSLKFMKCQSNKLILNYDIDDWRAFNEKYGSMDKFFADHNLNVEVCKHLTEDNISRTTLVELTIIGPTTYDILIASELLNKHMLDWFGSIKQSNIKGDRHCQLIDKYLHSRLVSLTKCAPCKSKSMSLNITPLMIACGHRGYERNKELKTVSPKSHVVDLIIKYAKTDAEYDINQIKITEDGVLCLYVYKNIINCMCFLNIYVWYVCREDKLLIHW